MENYNRLFLLEEPVEPIIGDEETTSEFKSLMAGERTDVNKWEKIGEVSLDQIRFIEGKWGMEALVNIAAPKLEADGSYSASNLLEVIDTLQQGDQIKDAAEDAASSIIEEKRDSDNVRMLERAIADIKAEPAPEYDAFEVPSLEGFAMDSIVVKLANTHRNAILYKNADGVELEHRLGSVLSDDAVVYLNGVKVKGDRFRFLTHEAFGVTYKVGIKFVDAKGQDFIIPAGYDIEIQTANFDVDDIRAEAESNRTTIKKLLDDIFVEKDQYVKEVADYITLKSDEKEAQTKLVSALKAEYEKTNQDFNENLEALRTSMETFEQIEATTKKVESIKANLDNVEGQAYSATGELNGINHDINSATDASNAVEPIFLKYEQDTKKLSEQLGEIVESAAQLMEATTPKAPEAPAA